MALDDVGESSGEGEAGSSSGHESSDQDDTSPDPDELPDYQETATTNRAFTPPPFPRERENLAKTEYLYVKNDSLNFQDKSKHGGPSFLSQIKQIAKLTGNFSNIELISDPTRAGTISKSIQNETGHLCANIRHKIFDGERISQREKHYLMKNRGWFYSGIAQVITTFLCAHLKAILTEEIQTNNWVEIQTQRTPKDCVECLTVHKRIDDGICSRRNLNGARSCDSPIEDGNWMAVMIGCSSYLFLPWQMANTMLNLSLTDPSDYVWDTVIPLHIEGDHSQTPLGRAIMKRINSLGPNRKLPLYVEFCWTKISPDTSFIHSLINFLKVIKSLQKVYLPPITVVMSLATPHKRHTPNSYEGLKKEFIRKSCVTRVVANCMGISFLELIVQRRPSFTNDLFQWNNSDHWNMEPIFNRHVQYTQEMNRRIAANFSTITFHMAENQIPKELFCYETDEVGEVWCD